MSKDYDSVVVLNGNTIKLASLCIDGMKIHAFTIPLDKLQAKKRLEIKVTEKK